MADRWLIQYGKEKDAMTIVGRAGTRANAAQVAQDHFDKMPNDEGRERIVFDPEDPAGEFCCADGWYRITRIGSGQWRRIE